MPDSPVGSQTCGTGAPGTLFGGHPTDIGIEMTRTVNFEDGGEIYRSIDAKAELQNVNLFTQSKTFKPNFTRRKTPKLQPFWHQN